MLSVGASKADAIVIVGLSIDGSTLNSFSFSIKKVGVPLSNQ